jgi:hypothetical protein
MATNGDTRLPWRAAILAPLAAVLFGLGLYSYNNMQPEVGLALVGFAFAVPMIWIVLAARDAESPDSQVRAWIPRMTAMLVLGSTFVGMTHWTVNRTITAIEAGFALFYMVAAVTAWRIIAGKPKRPRLMALDGGNLARRQRKRSS